MSAGSDTVSARPDERPRGPAHVRRAGHWPRSCFGSSHADGDDASESARNRSRQGIMRTSLVALPALPCTAKPI